MNKGIFNILVCMQMKLAALLVILTFCFTNCGQKKFEIESQKQITNSIQIDTSKIEIFPFDKKRSWIFKDCKQVELTNEDISKIENILNNCIDKYNLELEENLNNTKTYSNNYRIDLDLYKRQYIAYLNSIGEKEVWINCLCRPIKDWKNELIMVLDGGKCFFNLYINITKGRFYKLSVNGVG